MPIPADPRRQAALRLDEAFALYLEGETSGEAWVYARDYRDEGFDLAVKAAGLSPDERDELIEDAFDKHGGSAGYLVSAAFRFHLAELDADAASERKAA